MSNLTKIEKDNSTFKVKSELKDLNEKVRLKQRALEDLRSIYDKEKSANDKELKDLNAQVSGQKSLLKNIKKELKETKSLIAKQEAQLDEAVKNGNDHIMDLQYEANNVATIKTRLEYEVAQLSSNKDELLVVVRDLQAHRQRLESEYNEQNKLYQKTLDTLRQRIFGANSELKETEDRAKEIVSRLKQKELELSR